MAAGAAAAESTECTAGSLRNRRTSTSTALSRVAENSIRWPSGGVASISRRTTGRNPRSAMWSASLTTLISTSSRWQCPCSMRSASRPGQATTMSTRLRRAVTCGFCPIPPNMVVTVRSMEAASGARTAWTWLASSRVGTSTRPRGRQASVCPSASPATSGIAKPSVLPEPVRPRPRMSSPASASGSAAAWIGNGVRMPSPASEVTSGPGTPRSANVRAGPGLARSGRRLRACVSSMGSTVIQECLPDSGGRIFRGPPRPWKPARSWSEVRPARPDGDASRCTVWPHPIARVSSAPAGTGRGRMIIIDVAAVTGHPQGYGFSQP